MVSENRFIWKDIDISGLSLTNKHLLERTFFLQTDITSTNRL